MVEATNQSAARPVDPHRHLRALLCRQGKRYRRNLKRCRQEFSAAVVHDLRVSLRRLLATLELLGHFLPARRAEKSRRTLKRQLDAFGGLRDLQVQLARLVELPQPERAARSFRAFLRRQERKEITKARRAVHRFSSRRIARTAAELEAELRERSEARAATDLAALVRRANAAFARVGQLRAKIDPADSDTIHRARVAFKGFRYAVEALAPLLSTVTPRRLRAMRAYQNLMGDIQDATVLGRSAGKFARKKLNPETGAQLRAELERARRRLVRRYLKAADRLRAFGPLELDPVSAPHGPRTRAKAEDGRPHPAPPPELHESLPAPPRHRR